MGSEWLLGENVFRSLQRNEYILVAKHQLQADFCDGKIGPFKYKRKDGRIAVVGIFGKNVEPTAPSGFRIDYLIWSLRIYALLIKRINRSKIRHINFAQVLTPIPKLVRSSPNFQFGPVGGQGPWYKVRFLPIKNRLTNFVIFKGIYGLLRSQIKQMNVVFAHPLLAERFESSNVSPAIKLPREQMAQVSKRRQVVHVSRRVYFKLPELHHRLFQALAARHPEVDFMIIGKGWGNITIQKNLHFKENLPRSEIMRIFAESQFHINLSLELAGIVNLEAALNRCITIGSKNSGATYLLDPNEKFLIDLYDPDISEARIFKQVSDAIAAFDEVEAERQFNNASYHTF